MRSITMIFLLGALGVCAFYGEKAMADVLLPKAVQEQGKGKSAATLDYGKAATPPAEPQEEPTRGNTNGAVDGADGGIGVQPVVPPVMPQQPVMMPAIVPPLVQTPVPKDGARNSDKSVVVDYRPEAFQWGISDGLIINPKLGIPKEQFVRQCRLVLSTTFINGKSMQNDKIFTAKVQNYGEMANLHTMIVATMAYCSGLKPKIDGLMRDEKDGLKSLQVGGFFCQQVDPESRYITITMQNGRRQCLVQSVPPARSGR